MDLATVTSHRVARGREDLVLAPGEALLAGGTWLFSEPQPALSRLVDLTALGWEPAVISPSGLRLAATCTFAQLAALELPPHWIAAPLLRQCCDALLGSFKIWNAATMGGNLCLALPAGPMAALATALDGICEIWTPDGGTRQLPAAGFVLGPQRNALAHGEILRALDIPAAALLRRTLLRHASLSPLGRSAALLIGTLAPDNSFALTVTASTSRPVRLSFPAVPEPGELRARIAAEIPQGLIVDDVHGRPDWRRHMTFLLAEEIRHELGGAAPC
jgi:CO/xanthine dehydrogenase FAD-binding subunit